MNKLHVKTSVAIIAGSLACYATWKAKGLFAFYTLLPPDYWQVCIPNWAELVNLLAPGILVGVIMPFRPVRNVVVAIFLGFACIAVDLSIHNNKFLQVDFFNYLLLSYFYGIVSACCGAYLSGRISRHWQLGATDAAD